MRKNPELEARERVERAAAIIQGERKFPGVTVRSGEGQNWVVAFQTGTPMPVEVRVNRQLAARTDSHVIDFLRTTLGHIRPVRRS